MTHHPPTSAPPARSLPPRTQLTLLVAAGAVALFLMFGVPALAHLFAPKPPPPPPAPPPGTFVATDQQWATLRFATVQLTGFQSQTETEGKIATNDDHTTQVFSPFSGRVTRVFVKAGDRVRVGQPLFAVQAAEFVQAQADLATAEAQVKLTEAAEARQSELVKSNGAAVKDWQQSQADLAAARANLEAVKGRIAILGQSAAALSGRARGAETLVASPITGVVTQRSIGEGQNIASVSNGGTSPAFVVSDLSTVWLVGELRDADAASARVGQSAEVRVPALPGQVFQAKVDYVSPVEDPGTHRVTVRATIANPQGLLRPEMFAGFTLITDGVSQAVGAPEEGVIYEGDTARVWVVRSGHALELRQIKTGRTLNGLVEVLSGLKPGDRMVTSGSLFIDRAAQAD